MVRGWYTALSENRDKLALLYHCKTDRCSFGKILHVYSGRRRPLRRYRLGYLYEGWYSAGSTPTAVAVISSREPETRLYRLILHTQITRLAQTVSLFAAKSHVMDCMHFSPTKSVLCPPLAADIKIHLNSSVPTVVDGRSGVKRKWLRGLITVTSYLSLSISRAVFDRT